MTPELTVLALAAILQAVQIGIAAAALNSDVGAKWNSGPRDTTPDFAPLTGRLRRATAQIRSMALEGVFLRTVAEIGGLTVVEPGGDYLPASVTQAQIASRIGATREMVNQVFRELHKTGFLAREGRNRWRVLKPLPTKRQ